MLQKFFNKTAIIAAFLGVSIAVGVRAETPPKPPSPSEMREQAETLKKENDGDLRHVLHLQALARKEKDVIKLTCINDKLIQLKAQRNLFDTALLQLDQQISAGDDSPKTAYADLQKASSDIKKLRGEADGCAGELEMYKQESKSDVARPDLDDPTDGDPFHPPELDDYPPVDPPGFATPYK